MATFDDLNLTERQNLARASFLKMTARNILGDEPSAEPQDFGEGESFGPAPIALVPLADLKRKIKRQDTLLRTIEGLIPVDYKTYSGLSADHEKLRVYDSANYKEATQSAQQALINYEDVQDGVLGYLKSPKTVRELSRNIGEWSKIDKEYEKVRAVQARLNDIIEPLTDADRPGLLPRAQKERLEKQLNELSVKLEEINKNGGEALDKINEQEAKADRVADELAEAGSQEEVNKLELSLDAAMAQLAKFIDEEAAIREQFEETKQKIAEVEEALRKFSGKGRRGGLSFKEYIYGRLHYTDTTEFKAKMIYNALSNLQTEGAETDSLVSALSAAVYSGTPPFMLGRGRYFVERKFR